MHKKARPPHVWLDAGPVENRTSVGQKTQKEWEKTASHKPHCVSNDSPDNPEPGALQESLFDTRTSCACGGSRVTCAVRQCAVDDDSLGTIDGTNRHKTAVHVRSAAVAQKRIDISRVVVVITPAGVVLLT